MLAAVYNPLGPVSVPISWACNKLVHILEQFFRHLPRASNPFLGPTPYLRAFSRGQCPHIEYIRPLVLVFKSQYVSLNVGFSITVYLVDGDAILRYHQLYPLCFRNVRCCAFRPTITSPQYHPTRFDCPERSAHTSQSC